jgi:peptidoglycan hydrolase-like amidase
VKKLFIFFAALFVFVGILPSSKEAATEPLVQVKLRNYLGNQTSVTLKMAGSYYLNNSIVSNKTYTVKVENGAISIYDGAVKIASASDVNITPVNSIDHAFINTREYAGSIDFTVDGTYVRPVNTINLEEYVKSVVPSEMVASTWHMEALKSQAVAARTYAYFRLNKIIDDTTTNLVYICCWISILMLLMQQL